MGCSKSDSPVTYEFFSYGHLLVKTGYTGISGHNCRGVIFSARIQLLLRRKSWWRNSCGFADAASSMFPVGNQRLGHCILYFCLLFKPQTTVMVQNTSYKYL